jgi:uncharacterized protein (TIGR02265 family)
MDTPATLNPLELGTDEELQWRLSLTSPKDLIRGIIFNNVLDGVRRMGDEEVVRRCLEACGETCFLDFVDYTYELFLRLLYTAGRLLAEKCGGFEKALWWISYEAAKAFHATPAGRVLVLMAQGDPRRLISNLPASMQFVSKKTRECRVTLPGPKTGILVKEDLLPRSYIEGSMMALFHSAKVQGVQVHSRSLGPLENEYEFTWA